MQDTQIEARLALANRIARAAGQLTLQYFQADSLQVDRKGDGTPLTIADRQAEKYLREQIQTHFARDAIVGEEFEDHPGDSGYRWILDPIDGTKSFVCGVPLYGTMVGVDWQGDALIGSVFLPGLNEGIYAARGHGAWWFRHGGEAQRASVSKSSELSESVLVITEAETFAERGTASVYDELVNRVYFARTWGDVYGYLLVATGRVEIMIDPILNIWDAAAIKPILYEAGGRFTDWQGRPRIDSGDAIGTNGLVHDAVLEIVHRHINP